MSETKKDVLREVDDEAIRLAKTLVRTARAGAIATLDPGSGRPIATRVGMSTDIDGTPVIFVSALSAHTPALRADGRCSLLVGESGKGDPLAHARITLSCDARELARSSDDWLRVEARYQAHQPKSKLYAALPDFAYFRLEVASASLNGGFGKAYAMSREQVLSLHAINDEIAAGEMRAVEHMNADHGEAVALYATHYARASAGSWVLAGIDAEGIDIYSGDDVRRIFFDRPLVSAAGVRETLVSMAGEARRAMAESSDD